MQRVAALALLLAAAIWLPASGLWDGSAPASSQRTPDAAHASRSCLAPIGNPKIDAATASAVWRAGPPVAIAALAVALAACATRMLLLQRRMARLLESGTAARTPASLDNSPQGSGWLEGQPRSVGATPPTLSRRASGTERASGGTLLGVATPSSLPAFTSPFVTAARHQPFGASLSLSPPRSAATSGVLTWRPPRAPRATSADGAPLAPVGEGGSSRPCRGCGRCAACAADALAAVVPATDAHHLHTAGSSANHGGLLDSQASALPELMALIAAYQASAGTPRTRDLSASTLPSPSSLSTAPSDHQLLSGADLDLPLRLVHALVEPGEVEYLHGPNGRLEQLGAGASSRVYKALYNGEVVAAKEVDVGGSPEMREAFVTEALLLQHLRHPNLIGFFGLSLTADKGVILEEYCEGRDLHSALQLTAAGGTERLFGWARRGRRIAYEVAKALNYLHSKDVIHMDIKSGNVLLTASGEARLSDVGLSRHAALATAPAAASARCIGTFAWMAPELLLDAEGSCAPACDIYSYGVLLWEILTGERPLRGRLRAPRVPEECPQAVADLTMRCLSQNPADRPTAAQLLHELGALLLNRAFSHDRRTTNLLSGTTSVGGVPAAPLPRRSCDGMPLRTLRLEGAGGMRRSISFNYPLLAAAATGFDKPSVARQLAAAPPPAAA